MIRLFVRHPVEDFSAWKDVYDGFDQERRGMGVQGHGVFQSVEDPNDVTVWHDFESLSTAREFTDSPRLREVMSEAGVADEPTLWFTEPA